MDQSSQTENSAKIITEAVDGTLKSIDQGREKEIITRRFGLYDRKETLEQIGEMLGITRERVRQLEKAILARMKAIVADDKIDNMSAAERLVVRDLSEHGRVGRVRDIAERLVGKGNEAKYRPLVAFIAELSPKLTVVNENDFYHHSIGIAEHGDEKSVKKAIDEVVKTIKDGKEPIYIDNLHEKLPNYEQPSHVRGLASASKLLANLKDTWGLTKWPTVNPKNIRDKIFVILSDNGKPMHFSEIAAAIKGSDFKRKNVTTQAIHNELIKDKRFVLIGRGIYALSAWGYSRGTVSDVIADILREAGEPLHRDEIIKRMLKKRQVKETTVLLNLQSKSQFKRVAKATYALAEVTPSTD